MTIKALAEDWWECSCGNRPDTDGFYPCTKDGEVVEPILRDWADHYLCYLCGEIVRQKTVDVVLVVGRASPETMKKNDKFFSNP